MNHAAAQTAEVDYETLPPDPSEGAQKLAAAKVTMPQAIEMAMKASAGTVLSASAAADGDKVTYEVICAVGGVPQRIMVDGMTGAITCIKLSPLDAIVKASAKVNGVVRSCSECFWRFRCESSYIFCIAFRCWKDPHCCRECNRRFDYFRYCSRTIAGR